MKKKVLSLAIVAVMAPGFAAAADVSGFADIYYTIADDSAAAPSPCTVSTVAPLEDCKNDREGKFTANGEVDFSASPADGVTVRADIDLALGVNGGGNASAVTDGPADSGVLEQAFFAWGVTEGVTVIGGVFNDPIGAEAEDAPDMNFASHGVVYDILDGATTLYGDNVAGLAVAGAVGPVTLTAALLNDLGQVNEENSMAFVANYSPIKGLDLEAGMVTQKGGAEDVTNFNVSYSPAQVAGLTVGLDYLMADKVVDAAYDLWVGYSFGDFGAKVRLSDIDYTDVANTAGTNDTDATSIYLSYQAAKNLSAAIEFRTDGTTATPSVADKDTTVLELIAKF